MQETQGLALDATSSTAQAGVQTHGDHPGEGHGWAGEGMKNEQKEVNGRQKYKNNIHAIRRSKAVGSCRDLTRKPQLASRHSSKATPNPRRASPHARARSPSSRSRPRPSASPSSSTSKSRPLHRARPSPPPPPRPRLSSLAPRDTTAALPFAPTRLTHLTTLALVPAPHPPTPIMSHLSLTPARY
ncbi:hypothetical protein C8J57DRAFT_1499094 [Mycena rebaudengoi]|nr:hypothetical protein C8J57DRAFT_1499094 [Mycena rebaudengoi]